MCVCVVDIEQVNHHQYTNIEPFELFYNDRSNKVLTKW